MSVSQREVRELLDSKPMRAPALPAERESLWISLMVGSIALLVYLLCLPISPVTAIGAWLSLTPPPEGIEVLVREGILRRIGWALAWLLPGGINSPAGSILGSLLVASSALLTCLWLRQQDIGRRAAVIGGLLLAFSMPIWLLAVRGEPWALSLFLGLGALVGHGQWHSTHHSRWHFLSHLCLGFGIACGPEITPVALFLVLSRLTTREGHRSTHRWWPVAAMGLASGFLLAWPVSGLGEGFLGATLSSWTPAAVAAGEDPWVILADTSTSLGLLIGGLALLGVFIRGQRHIGDTALILTLASLGPVTHILFGSTSPLSSDSADSALKSPFTVVAAVAFASMTVDSVLQKIPDERRNLARTIGAIAAFLPLAPLVMHGSLCDYSGYKYSRDWSRSVLSGLPEGAVLWTDGDPRAAFLLVAQRRDGTRPDVSVVDPGGAIDPAALPFEPRPHQSPEDALWHLVSSTSRPVFSLVGLPLPPGHHWQPWGLVLKATAPGISASEDQGVWLEIDIPDIPADPQGAWRWIAGEGKWPPRDSLAATIAADYFFARAREENALDAVGPWSGVLALLGEMRSDWPTAQKTARENSATVISDGNGDSPRRGTSSRQK